LKVRFYHRPNCALCEEGLLILKLVQEESNFEIDMINIEEDDELHEKFMLMIPVIEKDGEIVQYGQIDFATLYEAFMNTP